MKKCNRDCFNCIHEDCIIETPTKEEREMQDYRDACATVTGKVYKAHSSGTKNRGRKGGNYDSRKPYKI